MEITNEDFLKMNKDELQVVLSSHDLNVVFEKADGTLREMNVTSQIPENKLPKKLSEDASEEEVAAYNKRQEKLNENKNNWRVFDRDLNEWRAISVDKIKSVNLV